MRSATQMELVLAVVQGQLVRHPVDLVVLEMLPVGLRR